jgi:hypothetical protein
MESILNSLKSISGYPVPDTQISVVATLRGLNLSEEATPVVLRSPAYLLATADILLWVSLAPDVQQAGVSYSISERVELRASAEAIYSKFGDEAYLSESKPKFGYKGNKL